MTDFSRDSTVCDASRLSLARYDAADLDRALRMTVGSTYRLLLLGYRHPRA